jgi:hypothetical protein
MRRRGASPSCARRPVGRHPSRVYNSLGYLRAAPFHETHHWAPVQLPSGAGIGFLDIYAYGNVNVTLRRYSGAQFFAEIEALAESGDYAGLHADDVPSRRESDAASGGRVPCARARAPFRVLVVGTKAGLSYRLLRHLTQRGSLHIEGGRPAKVFRFRSASRSKNRRHGQTLTVPAGTFQITQLTATGLPGANCCT